MEEVQEQLRARQSKYSTYGDSSLIDITSDFIMDEIYEHGVSRYYEFYNEDMFQERTAIIETVYVGYGIDKYICIVGSLSSDQIEYLIGDQKNITEIKYLVEIDEQ